MIDLARFVHILSAALWLGAALYWPGDLRRALEAGGAAPAVALRRASGALALDGGAGLATILTGGLLAGVGGANVVTMWGGLTLAAARLALLLLLARPAVARAASAATEGDFARARASAKGVAAYAGIAHLLWLLALVAMVFPL